MRLDDYSMSSWMMRNLDTRSTEVQRLQRQATSGQRLEVRSDAPVDGAALARLRQDSSQTARWKTGINTALFWAQSTEPQLTQLMENLQRAQELGVSGGDATLTPTDRGHLAAEVDTLLEASVSIANTRQGDVYIFGGTISATPPVSVVRDAAGTITTVTAVSGERRTVQTAPDQTLPYGTRAVGETDGLFVCPDPVAGPDRINLFNTLISLRDRLQAGQPPTGADMTALADTVENVASRMMENGIDQSRLGALDQQLLRLQDTQNSERAAREQPDLAQVLTQLAHAEAALTASMQVAGRMNRMNLLDYL